MEESVFFLHLQREARWVQGPCRSEQRVTHEPAEGKICPGQPLSVWWRGYDFYCSKLGGTAEAMMFFRPNC